MNVYTKNVTRKGKIYKYFLVDFGTINGKRVTRTYKDIKLANEAIRQFKRQREKYGSVDNLSPMEYNLAVKAFALLKDEKMDDVELIDAVQEYIKNHAAVTNSVLVDKALDLYMSSFSKEQGRHLDTIANKLKPFTNVMKGSMVSQIKESDIKAHLAKLEEDGYSVVSRNGFVSYAKSFFNWCIKEKYIASNPVTMTKEKVTYEDPVFIQVDDLQLILETLERDTSLSKVHRERLIKFYVLSFFCGIRSSEIHRIQPDAVHPEDANPYIRISSTKGATKGIKGRVVDLEPNVVAWLTKYPYNERITESAIKRAREAAYKGCLESLKNILAHNVGRHSYITYHVAKHRDYNRTEAYCGTSSGMRCKHYQGLAPTSSGIAYFDLFPRS